MKKSNQAGFTLIEVSFAIIILGLISISIVNLMFMQREIKSEIEAAERKEILRSSLAEYIKQDPANPTDVMNYPCPADPELAVGSPGFGVEKRDASGQCEEVGGVTKVTGTDGQDVFIGAVPTRTLNIGNINGLDTYGRQLTYAVSGDMAETNALEIGKTAYGAITVGTNQYTPFVVVSHGENGRGSYTSEGIKYAAACPASGKGDSENCNRDAVFANLEISTIDSDKAFDDQITYEIADKRVTVETCPDGARIVGVIKGKPECEKITMVCPVGQYMVGISDDTPICQSLSGFGAGPGSNPSPGTTVAKTVSSTNNPSNNNSAAITRVNRPTTNTSRNVVRPTRTSSTTRTAGTATAPDEGWLGAAYRTNLGRAPDSAGADFWLAQEKAGMSRADIVKTISNSCEARGTCGSTSSGQKELQGQAAYAKSYTSSTGIAASSRSTASAARTTARTDKTQYTSNPYIGSGSSVNRTPTPVARPAPTPVARPVMDPRDAPRPTPAPAPSQPYNHALDR